MIPLAFTERLRGDRGSVRTFLLPWALALAVGLDYFDNSMFSFYTIRIAGGIDAPPDELIWASSAYAVASVIGILGYSWWIERIGHRNYIAGCLFLFGLASLASAASRSSVDLAVARALQGYLMGPMLSATRILLRFGVPPERRLTAMPIYLGTVLICSALAPLVGGVLVTSFGWQALFDCTAPLGFVFGSLALLVIPSSGQLPEAERSNPELWPYVIFALGLAALQVVAQQVRFELFSASILLQAGAFAGLLALGWFIHHQWDRPAGLIRLYGLRIGRFRTGLVIYAFYYYITNALGYLVSRFLEGGLGYPIEVAGRLVGFTSLFSLAAMLVYIRYSSKVARKKLIIVPGFLVAALIAASMMSMPPDVSQGWLILPLMLRGALLMFIVLPNASVTFQAIPAEEYVHSYRIKNIVKQMAYSLGTASIIIVEQHRLALHETRFSEIASSYNPNFQNAMTSFTGSGDLASVSRTGQLTALARIATIVTQQATLLASIDGFLFIMVVALIGSVVAMLQRSIR